MPRRPSLPRLRRRRNREADVPPLTQPVPPEQPVGRPEQPVGRPEPPAQAQPEPEAQTTELAAPTSQQPATPAPGAGPAASPTEPPAAAGTAAGPDAPETAPPILGELGPEATSTHHVPRASSPALWPDWARRTVAVLSVLAVGGIGFAIGYIVDGGEEEVPLPGPSPTVVIQDAPQPEAVERIGFPEFATRNTTRVGGSDPIADAAGVALASYPSLGGVGGPAAVILAPADSWQAALAATPLAADPVAAPVLLSERDEVPDLTTEALAGLSPQGLEGAGGAQLITIGDVAEPGGLEELAIGEGGADAAEIAEEVDVERARLTGEENPDHLLVVSSEEPELAMPAASWAARSGDPILFAAGNQIPEPTMDVIESHKGSPIYVLGPEPAISDAALGEMEKASKSSVTRISEADDPVESSIDFARFVDGDFGWNINDPGHGFVIASAERPLDAAAGAPLSAGGKPGPLLVTTDPEAVPVALQDFLADTQPGFVDDPSRALYNHVWLLGNADALSIAFQAQVDELTKLVPVNAGTTEPGLAPEPEDETSGSGGADGSGSGSKEPNPGDGP